jgi:hypothetical protein
MNAGSPDDAPASPTKAMALTIGLGVIACGAAAVAFSFTIGYVNSVHAGAMAETAVIILYGAVIIGIATWLAKVGQRTMKMTPSAAAKRYQRRFLIAMALYVLALTGSIEAWQTLRPAGVLAYALAVLPALPLMGAIAVMGFYLKEETDEFERAVQAEAALWATGGLLAIASVWGFLEMFSLAPHVETWAAFPVWAVFLGPAQVLARRRYR